MASKRKNTYFGYKKPIPENLKVVEKIVMKEIDMDIIEQEKRYVIIDDDTGEIFDDAQGYGYKSRQKAYAALNYKKKTKTEIDEIHCKKVIVQKWWTNHIKFKEIVTQIMIENYKCNIPYGEEELKEMMDYHKLETPTDITYKELLKYMSD